MHQTGKSSFYFYAIFLTNINALSFIVQTLIKKGKLRTDAQKYAEYDHY